MSLVVALGLMLSVSTASAEPLPADCMDVGAIQAGMKGIGRTVFKGTTIESFEATIMGVLRKAEPNHDMILARLSSPIVDRAGVLAGMSGSPVHVDGKLIGAVARGWTFEKEPICGITPIGAMLEAWEAPASPVEKGSRPNVPSPAGPWPMGWLATPVYVSGVPPAVIRRLADRYKEHGLVPLQGGQPSGTAAGPGVALEPGAAMAALLVTGDMAIDAVGTVTYRKGDRVLAFGHPLFLMGASDIPVAPAYIHGYFPSYFISFKFAGAGPTCGVLEYDGAYAVSARIGAAARTFPFTVHIAPHDGDRVKTYRFEVAYCGSLTWLFVATLVDSVMSIEGRLEGDQSFRTRFTIRPEGIEPVTIEQMTTTRADHLGNVLQIVSPFEVLHGNRFAPVRYEGIELWIQASDEFREARIESVRLSKTEMEAGESGEAAVSILGYRGQREIVRLRFTVPADASLGQAKLHICDSGQATSREAVRNPGLHQPRDLAGLLRLLRHGRPADGVYLQLELARDGLSFGGRELPQLPGSAMAVLGMGTQTGFKKLASDVEQSVRTRWVVTGEEPIVLQVKERKVP